MLCRGLTGGRERRALSTAMGRETRATPAQLPTGEDFSTPRFSSPTEQLSSFHLSPRTCQGLCILVVPPLGPLQSSPSRLTQSGTCCFLLPVGSDERWEIISSPVLPATPCPAQPPRPLSRIVPGTPGFCQASSSPAGAKGPRCRERSRSPCMGILLVGAMSPLPPSCTPPLRPLLLCRGLWQGGRR